MAQPVVAVVVNTNPDLVELLKAQIEKAGFVVLVIHISDIREGLDVGTILAQHDPRSLCMTSSSRSSATGDSFSTCATSFEGRRFVLTTPNAAGLHSMTPGARSLLRFECGGHCGKETCRREAPTHKYRNRQAVCPPELARAVQRIR